MSEADRKSGRERETGTDREVEMRKDVVMGLRQGGGRDKGVER